MPDVSHSLTDHIYDDIVLALATLSTLRRATCA